MRATVRLRSLMAAKKYLFAFMVFGGLALAGALGLLLKLVTGHPNDLRGWAVLFLGTPPLLLATAYVFWFWWALDRIEEE